MKTLFSETKFKIIFSGIFLLLIVILILLNIFFRTVLNKSIICSVELCSVFIIWSIYAVFGVNYQEDTHLRIDLIDQYISKRMIQKLEIFSDLIIMITLF